MENWIKILLAIIFGPTILFLILGAIFLDLILIEIGIGYLLVWLVLAAFLYSYITRFNISYSRWNHIDLTKWADVERIEIPIGGGKALIGDLIKSEATPKKNAPLLVMAHGLGGSRKDYYMLALATIYRGYAFLLWDSRGHGDSSHIGEKYDSYYIIKDFQKVLDWVEKRPDLNHDRIVAIGGSMGASIVLNEGYLDPRVDFIIALCAWSDFQKTATRKLNGLKEHLIHLGYKMMGINLDPTNLQNRMVSPILYSFNKKKGFFDHPVDWDVDNSYRVVLGHCKDDHVINFENFEENLEFLKLPESNWITFEFGDHAFGGMETSLMGKFIFWLEQRGYGIVGG